MSSSSFEKFHKVHFTSLGCSKNLVDSQVMLGILAKSGLTITSSPEEAEVIIVNTCSFIQAAKEESIETILDLADFKTQGNCKALVVSGCMPQRYSEEMEKGLAEVDLFIGTGEYSKVAILLKALEEGKLEKKSHVEIPRYIHTELDPRINTSPFYMAWLKISEGCNRNCTFCIIPTIRGKLRSRSVESLVEEAKTLASKGVKELNIISQDLSDYGVDFSSSTISSNTSTPLYDLLKGLENVKGIEWIRLFYYYPEDLSEKVMELMAQSKKICPYLDMPIQHLSDGILKKMNRKTTGKEILAKVERLRHWIPQIVLRTSVIVGFPGETEEDFQQLLEGLEQIKFDHLGIFRYSDEESTPAFKIFPKVEKDIIEQRFKRVFNLQKNVFKKKSKKYLGMILPVLIEGPHPETELLVVGRCAFQAPDVDGQVIITDLAEKRIRPGDIALIRITQVKDFDFIGEVCD